MSQPDPPIPADNDPLAFLAGGGEMGQLIRSMDWSRTPLGPVETWPQSLRTAVSLCLASSFPINILWGPDRVQIYNDGYRPICGGLHPRSMGQDYRECWESAWPTVGPALLQALAGRSEFIENQRVFVDRHGHLEETFFCFSFSPVRDESGGVGGLFVPVTETTASILAERRTRVLRDLAARTSKAQSIREALTLSANTLAEYDLDLPFVLFYAVPPGETRARLIAGSGLTPGAAACPLTVDLGATEEAVWPLEEAARTGTVVRVDDAARRVGPPPYGPYPEPPRTALVIPIAASGAGHPAVLVVAGVSPRLPLNEAYLGFYDLLASGVATAVASARAYEEEKKRAEALAELDRAKTAFFSNVSHELRTPLTLILGPVEDLLSEANRDVCPAFKGQLEVVHRNGLRLLKLVNTMLDFSRIEAGRMRASYEPADLAEYTRELTGVFRAAFERAGVRLIVDCPPLPGPVFVDRDMWEKIVLNLLSNAFKFTLDGEVEVRLEAAGDRARLTVRDTGVGIPAEEMPRIFDRFHRVESARGRTHEGTGIGLALVHELVKLHGGWVAAESTLHRGSQLTVSIPFGKDHLDPARIAAPSGLASTSTRADAFVQEALRWLPSDTTPPEPRSPAEEAPPRAETGYLDPGSSASDPASALPGSSPRPRILWADDNADMRRYVTRLLSDRFAVEAVADGQAALEAARAHPPDLVLSDVMMPRLDGVGLLRALRADPQMREIPVILLSARAGEEARVQGMEEGADDYLIKPFAARELFARVEAHTRMARLRREATLALRDREAELQAEIARRKELAGRLASAQEDERRRVARDLHDSVGQLLASLSLAVQAASAGPLPPAASAKLADIQRVADLLGREVHGLAVRLRPTSLDDIGLPEALGHLIGEWSVRAGVPVDFHTTGLAAGRLPPEVETVLYRVVQEALTNVARHAHATQVSVVVSRYDGVATAIVEDDGVGLDPAASSRGRLGLVGMRERVTLAGGDIEIESSPGKGTTVVARVPVLAPEAGAR